VCQKKKLNFVDQCNWSLSVCLVGCYARYGDCLELSFGLREEHSVGLWELNDDVDLELRVDKIVG